MFPPPLGSEKSAVGEHRIMERMSSPSDESVDVDMALFLDKRADWRGLVKLEADGEGS